MRAFMMMVGLGLVGCGGGGGGGDGALETCFRFADDCSECDELGLSCRSRINPDDGKECYYSCVDSDVCATDCADTSGGSFPVCDDGACGI